MSQFLWLRHLCVVSPGALISRSLMRVQGCGLTEGWTGRDSASKLTIGVVGRIHSSWAIGQRPPSFLGPMGPPEGTSQHSGGLSSPSKPASVIKANDTVLWEGSIQKCSQEAEIIGGYLRGGWPHHIIQNSQNLRINWWTNISCYCHTAEHDPARKTDKWLMCQLTRMTLTNVTEQKESETDESSVLSFYIMTKASMATANLWCLSFWKWGMDSWLGDSVWRDMVRCF